MLFYILALFLCSALVDSDKVNSSECPGITHNCRNVELSVSECTTEDQNCPLYKGQSHEVVWCFEPTKNFTGYTKAETFGIFPTISTPIRYGRSANACNSSRVLDSEDTCNSLKGFLTGKHYCHSSSFPVSRRYPNTILVVRFAMQDRRSKEILCCTQVPVEIKDKESK